MKSESQTILVSWGVLNILYTYLVIIITTAPYFLKCQFMLFAPG